MENMLEARNISLYYGKREILKDINFEVGSNETLCIIGPNGCGKTTLIKALCNIIEFEGEILVNGKNIKKIEAYREIAMMSQISNIYFGYRVYDAVMMGRYLNFKDKLLSMPSKEDKDFVEDCINKLKISHLKDKLITQLSGGELQRVFLARTLAQNPNIIVMDEPTNHLDLNSQIDLVSNLKNWVKYNRRCIVAVLHDINIALSFADKLIVLNNGMLQYYGSVANFNVELLNEIYNTNIVDYMRNSLSKWN